MQQLSEFIVNHWLLVSAFIAILVLVFINEMLEQRKQAASLSPEAAVLAINHEDAIVIDIRDSDTYRHGHILSAIRANPADFEANRMDKYKDKAIVLACARGLQSAPLAAKLKTLGFTKVHVLAGGISAWQAAGYPLVKGK